MEKVDSEGSNPNRKILLVLFNHEGRPELFPRYTDCSTLEQNRTMNEWFDEHSREARDVIRTLGGVILQQNWFWVGLETALPTENLDSSIKTISEAPNVTFTQLQQREVS